MGDFQMGKTIKTKSLTHENGPEYTESATNSRSHRSAGPHQNHPRISIVNSPYGPDATTSIEHAWRIVHKGHGEFVDHTGRIVITQRSQITSDMRLYLCQRVIEDNAAQIEERRRVRLAAAGYDGIDREMRMRELKHIPIVCAEKLLNCGRKRRKGSAGGGE